MQRPHFEISNHSLSKLGGILSAGAIRGGAGVLEPARILGCYSLVLVIDGRGSYRDNTGVAFELLPGDIVLVDPDCNHWYGPDTNTVWDEIFLIFEGPLFDLWAENNLLDLRRKRLRFSSLEQWVERFVHACGSQHQGSLKDQFNDLLRVQQLLYQVHEACKLDSRGGRELSPTWLDKAKHLVEVENDLHNVASIMDCTYQTFRKKFKQQLGMAPQQYRIHKTMQKAQYLLMQDTAPIYQIAEDLGYCDEFHFSKQFKKCTGYSPSEYRSTITETIL